MRDVERARRDREAAHDHEAATTPGRMTNVPERGATPRGGAPYTTATMTGDRPPWSSDRPVAEPSVDLTPRLSSGPAPAPAAAPPAPGLAEVKNLYAPYGPGDGVRDPGLMADIARIVEKHPEEEAAIRAYIEARDGVGAGHALVAALEESKRKKNGVRREGGTLDLGNPLLPRIGLTVPGGVTKKKDNAEEKQLDADNERDKRAAQAHLDQAPDTIVDWVNKKRSGPQGESEDTKRNGDKLMRALEEERKRKAQGDGGTPD